MKDHRKLVEQRRTFNLQAGNVINKAFNSKSGRFNWENKRKRK